MPDRLSRREFLKILGASAALLGAGLGRGLASAPRSSGAALPNILVLVFDTLTARDLALYGYHRGNSPNLERFAQRATVYHRHYAAGNYTTPGTASLLTGVYPWTHRALHLHGTALPFFETHNLFALLGEVYHTFAYTHNPMAYFLLHQFRAGIDALTPMSDLCLAADTQADTLFGRDFGRAYESELLLFRNGAFPAGSLYFSLVDKLQRFRRQAALDQVNRETFPRGVPNYLDEERPSFLYFTLEQTIDWLKAQLQTAPAPFLGYVHVLPPHGPYTTRHEFVDRFKDGWQPPQKPQSCFSEGYEDAELAEERRLYDESIAYIDDQFGHLLDFMQESGLLDNTCLFVTSDHGELFERGIYTHITPVLYEPLVHIPLLVSRPGQEQRVDVSKLTSSVDLLPTLLEIAGLPRPDWLEGEALPKTEQQGNAERRIFVVEAKENPQNAPLRTASLVLLAWPYKLMHTFGYSNCPNEAYELYHLEDDPEELHNLYDPADAISAALARELAQRLEAVNRKG